ncbi:MAG TPA: hypothetical protein VL523_05855 [Terriglobia bacterium]|nr:hypothetical protein [Terriglobia bacterium]
MARENVYDVAVIFSQDHDLSEAADEVKAISVQQGRWIKVACAFPLSPTTDNRRGINQTEWITIDRATYDTCLDPIDYRLESLESSASTAGRPDAVRRALLDFTAGGHRTAGRQPAHPQRAVFQAAPPIAN